MEVGAKKDHTKEIINAIVLETGYSIKSVEKIVDSFLAIYQDKISDGTVYLQGFGEMKAVIEKRRYYDINQGKMDETRLKPMVKFKPTVTFLNLIRHSQK